MFFVVVVAFDFYVLSEKSLSISRLQINLFNVFFFKFFMLHLKLIFVYSVR